MMERNDERRHDDLTDLGAASAETKGFPIVGDPDTAQGGKLGGGITDDD